MPQHKAQLEETSKVKEQIKNAKKSANNNHYMKNQAIKLSAKDKKIAILTKQNKQLRRHIDELKEQL